MVNLFHESSFAASRKITELYSTSFTLGINALDKQYHDAIYGIYGFVRYADEIVDTLLEWDNKELLRKFKEDAYQAIEQRISMNPVLNAFQLTVHRYNIDRNLIEAFLRSMEMDLYMTNYKQEHYNEYIYGSAEVVGLMCLKVFCDGDETLYQKLISPARSLGAAFQKVNFLRDLRSDFKEKGRVYFPDVDFENFCEQSKDKIEREIELDFTLAFEGIRNLPATSRFGVYLAYRYYMQLFRKIQGTHASEIMRTRIRISDIHKLRIWFSSYFNSNILGIYAR